MADEGKAPVAVRITRPYETVEDFLARELDTLTRTSIVLLGAQQRPQGVILRFEVALASGSPLVRGEGRVVAYKEGVFEGMPGLTLRFTRLDSRSKALVDRAAAMRDARSRPPPPVAPAAAPVDLEATRAEAPVAKKVSSRPPPMGRSPSALPPPLPTASRPPTAPTPARPSVVPVASRPPVAPTPSRPPPEPRLARFGPSVPPAPPVPLDLETTRAEAPQPKRASERPPPREPSASDRDALLGRLRERRRSLDEDTVSAILAKKPSSP